MEDLGSARKVNSTKDNTYIVDGKGDENKVTGGRHTVSFLD